MASGKQRAEPFEQTAEGVELNRDVLSALAHELGGIASALDLRASAMSRTVSGKDLDALREIAGQIRLATRAARFARGADGFGMLNPNKHQTLDEWWKLAERFTSAVLPRGIAIETQFAGSSITASQASTLTWLWLSACKEAGELELEAGGTLIIRGASGNDGTVLEARLEGQLPSQSPSRWRRFSTEMARDLGAKPPVWEQRDGMLHWSVEIPR